MVQIFVKVDGMKTVAMEVSPEDKVQKILNTVSGSDWDVYVTSGGRILRGSDKLKSCEVRDGSTVQVMSRMRGGGKHKDKKGKEEKKQVAQLDDGMCAMACEQMRQVMETLRTLADKSTGEDKRCVVEKVEEGRKAIVGLRKQARGEDLQRVAELEESLKRLEEEMLPWSVEEQEQRRQEEQRRQGEQEEQRRQEEQEQRRQEEREHATMRNVAMSARMAAKTKTTAVTSATAEAGDESTDEAGRKGKGKGNGGKGEHEGKGGGVGRKGTRKLRWADCEEEVGARQGVAEEEWHKARKEQGIMWLDGSDEEQEGREGSAGGERCEVCGRVEVWSEEQEEEKRGQGKSKQEEQEEEKQEEVKSEQEAREEQRAQEAREEERRAQEAQEQRRAQEAPELRRSVREVSAQEEQAEQEKEVEAQGGQQENANSVHEECHVSNRHMTWWHNAWWIRVGNGPHMRSARKRRRVWRAARRAAEQARDEDGAGEAQRLAEEAEREKWVRRQTERQTD